MTICFIYTTDTGTINHPLESHWMLPLGFASVITCVLNAGNMGELLVIHNTISERNIYKQIKKIHEKKPILIYSFTAVATQMPFVLRIAQIIRKIDPDARILLGGPHPSLNPELCISHEEIDMICVGEGEYAVPLLIDRLKRGQSLIGVNNIWIKEQTGTRIQNPLNQWIENLDDIPFINRDIWRPWIGDFFSMPSVLIGRGCVNQCSFCSNHAIKNITHGKYVRYRSADNIVQEVIQLKSSYPDIEKIYFEIETAALNLDNIYDLCDKLSIFNTSLSKPIGYKINLSPNKAIFKNRENIVKKFIGANLKIINIGLESGSERIRGEILNRPKHTNEEFIEFCKYLQDNGIMIHLNVMVGFPSEKKSEFLETLNLVNVLKPSRVNAYIFHPYPGTKLYDNLLQLGLVNGEELFTPSERRIAVLSFPDFSKEEIQEALHQLESLNIDIDPKMNRGMFHNYLYLVRASFRGTWFAIIYSRIKNLWR